MFFYVPVKIENFLQSLVALGVDDIKFPNIYLYFSTGLVGTKLDSSLEVMSPDRVQQSHFFPLSISTATIFFSNLSAYKIHSK